MALRGDGEKTSDMLAKLSTFLRFSLDNSPSAKITLQQDENMMREYLAIEGVRFGERLQLDWQIAPNARQVLVPSFLIQPLIENAIKHALAKRREPLCLTILAKIIDAHLVLVVSDNGPLTSLESLEQSNGIGLKNIRQRLALFYRDDHKLKLSVNEPHGLKVEITVPVDKEVTSR